MLYDMSVCSHFVSFRLCYLGTLKMCKVCLSVLKFYERKLLSTTSFLPIFVGFLRVLDLGVQGSILMSTLSISLYPIEITCFFVGVQVRCA